MTARAKGLTERRVLYGHVFRNAMLIVIAGFPSLFIGVFFGGRSSSRRCSRWTGWAGWASRRRWRATTRWSSARCSFFALMGLLIGILSDLTYVLVDPRIDFEKRARLDGRAVADALNQRRWRNFRRNGGPSGRW